MDRRAPVADEELTAPRELQDLVSTTQDDLDEETAIIQGGAQQEAVEAILRSQAESARQGGQARAAAQPVAREVPEVGVGESTDVPTNVNLPRSAHLTTDASPVRDAAAPTERGAAARISSVGGAPARGPQAATEARARPTPLPAVRVAVVAGAGGEARLVPLGEGDAPPVGSALAILVPLSEGDGSAIARLLGL